MENATTHRPNPAKLNEVLRELSKTGSITCYRLTEIAGDQQRAALLLHHLKKRRLVELPGAASGEDGLPESLSISRKGRIVLTTGGICGRLLVASRLLRRERYVPMRPIKRQCA